MKLLISPSFILEGLFTVLMGVASFFLIHDFPETAKFLSSSERSWVIRRVRHKGSVQAVDNIAVVEETERFKWKYVWRSVIDWQVLIALFSNWGTSCTIYGMSFFLPTIVNQLGYTGNAANLLTIPAYVLASILTVILTFLSDRWRCRSPFVLALLSTMFCGYVLALAGSATDGLPGLVYAGVFIATACCYPGYVILVASLLVLDSTVEF